MQSGASLQMAERSQTEKAESAAILFSGVSKRFIRADGSELVALENISLTVARRSIVALLGPSGSGKTTLLNMAAGLMTADAGDIRIGGRSLEQTQWGRIGYMFQDDRLLPWRSAAENVGLALEATSMRAAERRTRSLAMLELMALREFADTYPHELSGGMRSRVALARSLVTDADILLMDEPFARLDVQTRAAMHAQLLALQADKGLTILFVTHDAEEAVMLADQIVVLSPRPGRMRDSVAVQLVHPRKIDMESLPLIAALRGQIGMAAA